MVLVQHGDFDGASLVAALRQRSAGTAGALVTFTGYVRDYTTNDTTQSLFLEHYPGMCEDEIQALCDTAQSRWAVDEPVVVHRVGELHRQEQIVFVGVASAHRTGAFRACEYIIDALKTRAPFWKRETLASGKRFWVQQHTADSNKTAEWDNSDQHEGIRS